MQLQVLGRRQGAPSRLPGSWLTLRTLLPAPGEHGSRCSLATSLWALPPSPRAPVPGGGDGPGDPEAGARGSVAGDQPLPCSSGFQSTPLQRASGEGHHLKSKRPNPCAYTPPSLKAVQRIAESHLQSISNLSENQASEEEDELGELRELGYPREEDEEEEEEDDDDEEEEEDSQAEVLKGSRGSAGQKTTCGQGLESPWERPPPLDEPQRDGSSKEQVEDLALNEPGEGPQRPTHPEPGT
ncbi:protein phosphatase 1 regulatory subunit 1B isoform X1 [Canis lupus familiaris]|uniref:protein phosphatase 1 regulatory subunit 1B isoform X1 n=1 Tax=Canis lupus familiaris TaxID=9615 RepID=UPI0015F1BE52|nr:protein phosphatase 1 regulatory subunit 1B isoform X1 [Canis lupus familiaris]